jgi:hypothetical protein
MTAKQREPRLCEGDRCKNIIQNPKYNQRFCSPECRPQLEREPIMCQGEGCGKLILRPRLHQRFCEPSHSLSLAVRELQAQRTVDDAAQAWSESRETEHELRERLLPCVTCEGSPRVNVYYSLESFPKISISCCADMWIEQGIEAAVSLWNRTPLKQPSRPDEEAPRH